MDMAKIWLVLLCVYGSWTGRECASTTIQCDWITEYEHGRRCCKACPSGEYPKTLCSQNSDSQCVKCPPDTTGLSAQEICFCKDKHLCFREHCKECKLRDRCKPGEQLIRSGNYDFGYVCEKCQEGTYNDAEDSSCKPITRCDGIDEIFPGNRTHNARCSPDLQIAPSTNPPTENPGQHSNQLTHSIMVACLIVIVLSCLAFIMYAACQIFKYKMFIKLNKPHTHSTRSDSCACKLSKEEMGEEHDLSVDKCEARHSLR